MRRWGLSVYGACLERLQVGVLMAGVLHGDLRKQDSELRWGGEQGPSRAGERECPS
jgi:hypothetical protein